MRISSAQLEDVDLQCDCQVYLAEKQIGRSKKKNDSPQQEAVDARRGNESGNEQHK
jgi:hypothetical protein